MALYDTLCFLLFGTFLCSLPMLHGCEKQNVCTFPVYPTEYCPRNQTEWDKKSSDMNCNETNSYMCVPNEKFTELLEFCYKHPRMLIVQDTCLYLSRSHYDVNIYDCRNFEYGCPSYHYLSSSIYKYPSCVHVKNGCFVAEPSCRRQPPERENQINITTIAITLGVSIPTCVLCILFVYFVIKRKYIYKKRNSDFESPGEEECTPLLPTTDLNKLPLETNKEGYTLVTNNNSRTAVRVCKSKKCCRDAEFYCFTCELEMCLSCMEDHVNLLYEKEHQVEICRAKINSSTIDEYCAMHSKLYRMYCKECQVPTCPDCIHPDDNDITESYQVKRKQVFRTVITIRTDALFYRKVLLAGIIPDFKTSQNQFKIYQSEMLTKAQTLKNRIDKVKKDFMYNVLCDFDFKHRCLKQMMEMSRHIISLQKYERRYEQPECTLSALKFLSFIKIAVPQTHLTLHTSQLSMTESLNKEDVMESLSTIQISVRGTRKLAKDQLLTLMPAPKICKRVEITDITRCYHISIVKIGQVCVNDSNKLILINDVDKTQRQVKAEFSASLFCGMHAVSKEKKLYFIDKEDNINQLSDDMSTTTTIVKKTDDKEKLLSFCISWSTGDLLVGKLYKVERYKHNGELKQIIPDISEGCKLFGKPYFITENKNADIVVSDFSKCAVIVTDMRGRHRFSYTGSPPNALNPMGICTDVLSHILVWDYTSKTVQLLDKDGQFLYYLLENLGPSFKSCSLSYDVNTHYLWVGSEDSTVRVYKYITRK